MMADNSSGLAVQDPNKPGQGAHRGIVDNILKQAAAYVFFPQLQLPLA